MTGKEQKEAKVFMSGRSQAIRLPLEFRFAVDSVTITRIGDALVIRPKVEKMDEWDTLKAVVGTFDNTESITRDQPELANEREDF